MRAIAMRSLRRAPGPNPPEACASSRANGVGAPGGARGRVPRRRSVLDRVPPLGPFGEAPLDRFATAARALEGSLEAFERRKGRLSEGAKTAKMGVRGDDAGGGAQRKRRKGDEDGRTRSESFRGALHGALAR